MKTLLMVILVPLCFLATPARVMSGPDDANKCAVCHSAVIQGKVTHLPVNQGCSTCHQSNGQAHPQEGVTGFTFPKEVPDLCYTCHDPLNTKEVVHAIVKNGKCMICHTPHNSDNKSLLKTFPIRQTCEECHDNLELAENTSKHQPVEQGMCQGCHDPHQSANPKLLIANGQELCYSCHPNARQELAQKSVHPPFANKCVICHSPHGSKTEHMLTQNYNELCYGCHDVLQAEVDEAPVKHKVLENANSCSKCHSPHSSPNAKLVKASPVSVLCLECHKLDHSGKASVHGAVTQGLCTGCHDPHKSANKSLVKDLTNELCLNCHEQEKKGMELAYVHAPFKNKCSICHVSHDSEEPALLKQNLQQLCVGCHDDFEEPLQTAALVHQPLKDKKSCTNCHSPHASDKGKILLAEEKTLCLTCHTKPIKGSSKTIAGMKDVFRKGLHEHGAITKDGCSSCHNPHYAENPYLLPAKITDGFYVKGVAESFAFCFTCHDSQLLTAATTTSATSFRDGDRNLHAVHVSGDKGRNCTVCHEIHTSDNEHLLKENILFGTWTMSMKYTQLDGGGTCQTGCHSDKTYKR